MTPAAAAGPAGRVTARDVVRVSGADAATYLQGQISQDVDAVAVDASAWSLVLEPRGKVNSWFRLTRRAEDFLLDLDSGFASELITRLERFKLRVDVGLETLDGWRMLSVRGPGAAEFDPATITGTTVAAPVGWAGFEGIDLLGPGIVHPPGLRELSAEEFEVARIRAGWPALGRELTDATIPAEVAGVVEASVSFTKGCYTGQELVARIDSRGGNAPRPVRVIEIAGDAEVAVGDEVEFEGAKVGAVTSVAFDHPEGVTVALAVVHRRVQPPAEVVVNGREATVLSPPGSGAG